MSTPTEEAPVAGLTVRTRFGLGPHRLAWPRRDRLVAGGVYLAVLVACGFVAYWTMYSQFATSDDEGFFDYSLNLFLTGHHLYTSVFSDYGPFYYEVFGGLFHILGQLVTTDSGRLVEIVVWIAATGGLGIAAHRLSGRLSIGIAALATGFTLMVGMSNEPMHPEALISLTVVGIALVIAFGLPRWPRASLWLIGALAACLLLTKVNVGVYAIVAIGFAAAMTRSSPVRYSIFRRLAILAFVLVGPAVMASKLNTGWVRSFALLVVLSTASIALIADPVQSRTGKRDQSADWIPWLLVGFVQSFAVVLAVVIALGAGALDLFRQTVIVPSHQGSILVIPLGVDNRVFWWALASTACAWTVGRLRLLAAWGPTSPPKLWIGLLRVIAGLLILFALTGQLPFVLEFNAPFAFALPLAWIAALPSRRDPPEPIFRLIRLLIPSLAVLQTLVAYPVAGTQSSTGSLLLVLCAAVCLADGTADLVAWNSLVRPLSGPVAETGLTALLTALAAGLVFLFVVQPLETAHDAYRANVPLRVHGATALRLPASQAAHLSSVIALLHREGCHAVMSLPGLYSLNVMSGLPAASPLTGEQPYWQLLSGSQQRAVVAAAKATPRLCAVRVDGLAQFYGAPFYGGFPTTSPVVAYVEDAFRPVAQIGYYSMEVRR